MALLSSLGIPHSVIHDSDKNDKHERVNEIIENSKTDMTDEIYILDGDFEIFLGLPKNNKHSYRKPLDAVSAYMKGQIDREKMTSMRRIIVTCPQKLVHLHD